MPVFVKSDDVRRCVDQALGHKPQVANSCRYAAPSDDSEVIFYRARSTPVGMRTAAFAHDCASSEQYDKELGTAVRPPAGCV